MPRDATRGNVPYRSIRGATTENWRRPHTAGDNAAMPGEPRDHRRQSPRIRTLALCWELVGDAAPAGGDRGALAVDLSPEGLCLERPYVGGATRRSIPLQLEVPGIDEVMWARADACFDILVPRSGPAGGSLGLLRRTGYRIVAAATRDLRRLKELVIETDRVTRRELDTSLAMASCYLRG
jgi:hypothetical protein